MLKLDIFKGFRVSSLIQSHFSLIHFGTLYKNNARKIRDFGTLSYKNNAWKIVVNVCRVHVKTNYVLAGRERGRGGYRERGYDRERRGGRGGYRDRGHGGSYERQGGEIIYSVLTVL